MTMQNNAPATPAAGKTVSETEKNDAKPAQTQAQSTPEAKPTPAKS